MYGTARTTILAAITSLAAATAALADPPRYTLELLGPASRVGDMNAHGQGDWIIWTLAGAAINDAGQIAVIAANLDTQESGVAVLTPITLEVPGDVDGDGAVNTADLLALLGAWGPCNGGPADIDGDGAVGTADLLVLLANWG